MIAVLLATLLAPAVGFSAWRADQRLLRCGSKVRARLAIATLLAGTWVCTFIQAMFIFKIPGADGPVQYWSIEDATSMTGPRMLSLALVFAGLLLGAITMVAAVHSFSSESRVPRWRRALVPSVAMATIAIAAHWYDYYGLLPTA